MSKVSKLVALQVLLILCVGMLLATPAAFAQKTKLVMWTMPHAGIPIVKATQGKMFQEKFPNVEIDFVNGWLDKVITMIAGGSQLDLVYYAHDGFVSLASQGLLMDLTPYFNKERGFKEQFFPAAINAGVWQGKQFALPESVSTSGLFYNKNMLDALGILYPREWTWDDLLRSAKKLTRDLDGDGAIDEFGFSDRYPISGGMENWIWQSGGEVFNADFSKALLDTPESLRGMHFQHDLYYTHHVGPTRWESESWGGEHRGPEKMFRNGKLALLNSTRYYIADPEGGAAYDWDIAPLAKGPGGMAVGMAMDFNAILSTSKYPDLAWEFIKFMNSRETQATLLRLHSDQAVLNGVAANMLAARDTLSASAREHNENYWIESMGYARAASITRYPPAPADTVYRTFTSRLGDVISGKTTMDNMLVNFTRELNVALARVPR